MGYFLPGRSLKRRKVSKPRFISNVNKQSVLASSPEIPLAGKSTQLGHAASTTTASLQSHRSILERFPVELLHEVVCFLHPNDIASLSSANQYFFNAIRYSNSLGLRVLKSHIHHLVLPDDSHYRVLEHEILLHKFINLEILKYGGFDMVMTREIFAKTSMVAEEQRQINVIRQRGTSPEEGQDNEQQPGLQLEQEPQREQQDQEPPQLDDQGAPQQGQLNPEDTFVIIDNTSVITTAHLDNMRDNFIHDYPERFYRLPFTEENIEMIQFLTKCYGKNLLFTDVSKMLWELIRQFRAVDAKNIQKFDDDLAVKLVSLMECSTKKLTDISPLLTAAGLKDFAIADIILTYMPENREALSELLWMYKDQCKKPAVFEYLLNAGFRPNLNMYN